MKIINSKHQKLINIIEERVLKKHPQANIRENIDYNRGEIDLLCAFSIEMDKKEQDIIYVFEMKSSDSRHNFQKANSKFPVL